MLLVSLKISIAALIFAIGMSATIDDIVYLWRRPVLLVKSVVAMYGVMPGVAVAMALVLDLPSKTELALVVLAICAGAPLLPKKLIKFGGDPAYVFSLIVTTSLLAVVTVPLLVYILADALHLTTAAISPAPVARIIFQSFLLPLGLGLLVNRLAPTLAARVGDPLIKVAGSVLLVCGLVALALGLRLVAAVGWPSLLAFAVFTLAAMVTGHLLGGPDGAHRTSLAIACASRHIGLALLIAANQPGIHALALVAAYLLASGMVSIGYVRWARRRRSHG